MATLSKSVTAIVLVVAFVFWVGCGSRGDGGSAVSVTATLNSSDYAVSRYNIFDRIVDSFFFAKPLFAVGATVNKVWALPLYNGEFHPSVFAYAQQADVSGGSFSLGLDQRNWILLLLNTNAAARADQVVGYVTMTAGNAKLLNFPLGAASGTLDLGQLSAASGETTSTRTAAENTTVISMSADQLSSIAQTDDTLKVVKNSYRNYDGTHFTSVKPFFAWNKSSGASSVIGNTFSNVATTLANDFKGYLFYLNSNDLNTVNFSRLCAGSDVMTLTPPSNVTNNLGTITFTTASPLSSAYGTGQGQSGTSCGVGKNLYIRDDSATYSSIQYNFSANATGDSSNGYLALPVVSGVWNLKINGTSIATFEGDLGDPFENDDSTKPIVPVPSVKANISGGNVTSVEIKWYQRAIGGSTFSEVTDGTILAQLSSVAVGMTDYSSSPYRSEMSSTLTPSTGFTFTPSGTWGTTSGISVAVSYSVYGNAYHFDWRF